MSTIEPDRPRPAVVLLSGGLDSATVLADAVSQGYACFALTVDYGQRHQAELAAATRVAQSLGVVQHRVMRIDLRSIGGSALTDSEIEVPTIPSSGIPVTYVPARNTLFLALALGWAEVLQAGDLFIGVNAVDYSGYPDCRPAFIDHFQALANVATKAGVEGHPIRIKAPLQHMSKADIVREANRLGLDTGISWSCYDPTPDGKHCGLCDSCRLRSKGYQEAGLPDPTLYAARP